MLKGLKLSHLAISNRPTTLFAVLDIHDAIHVLLHLALNWCFWFVFLRFAVQLLRAGSNGDFGELLWRRFWRGGPDSRRSRPRWTIPPLRRRCLGHIHPALSFRRNFLHIYLRPFRDCAFRISLKPFKQLPVTKVWSSNCFWDYLMIDWCQMQCLHINAMR